MTRQRRAPLGLLVALALGPVWLLAPATAAAGDPCYHGFELPPIQDQASTQGRLDPCAFSPTIARVPVGATVTFSNGGDFTHLITGANQTWGDRDVEIHPYAKATYSFDTAGIYPYGCALHRGMSGVIIVGGDEPAGAAPAGSGPAATPPTTAGTETAPIVVAAAGLLALVVVAAALLRSRRRAPIAAAPPPEPGTR